MHYIRSIEFAITDKCNFKCSYCSVDVEKQLNSNTPKVLNRENIFEFLQWYLDHNASDSHASILLNGKEPSLEISLIQDIINFCTERNFQPSISFQTNGSLLLTPAWKKLIFSNKRFTFNIGLSIDGDPSAQQARFKIVDFKTIHKLFSNFANFSVICVFGISSLPKLLDNLKYIAELGFKNVHINNIRHEDFSSKEIFDLYTENITKVWNWLCDELKSGNKISVNLDEYNYRYGELFLDRCERGAKSLSITNKGDFRACSAGATDYSYEQKKYNYLGSIKDKSLPSLSYGSKHISIEKFQQEFSCKTCAAYQDCTLARGFCHNYDIKLLGGLEAVKKRCNFFVKSLELNKKFVYRYRKELNLYKLRKEEFWKEEISTKPSVLKLDSLDKRNYEICRDILDSVKYIICEAIDSGVCNIFEGFLNKEIMLFADDLKIKDYYADLKMPWYYCYVTSNGLVFSCTGTEEMSVGDVFKDSLIKIWNGSNLKSLRLSILKADEEKFKICLACKRCLS